METAVVVIGAIAAIVWLIIMRSRRLVRQNAAMTQKAAEQGDASAQFMLGLMYADGHGVPRDYVKAVQWWQMAAEQGLANAQSALGFIYANGKCGVPKDEAKAVHWYQQAAQQGDAAAQSMLEKLGAKR
jgi:hypothetical protein